MTAVASAAPLFHGLWQEPWLWWLLRFVTGYCFAVLYVVIESWLNEQSTNETRGAVFSAYTLITLTVLAVGQQMLLLYDPRQMSLFAIASAIVSIAAIPVVLSAAPSPAQAEKKVKLNLRRLYRISPTGMLGCLAAGLANGAFWALAPSFVFSYSSDVSLAAWFMTAAVLGGAAGQWPLGLWSDRVDRRWVIAFASLVGLVMGLLVWQFYSQVSTLSLMLMSAAWGAVAFPIYAVAVANANDNAEPGEFVMISSGLLLMYGLGAIAGPFLTAILMDMVGPGGLYLFAAVIHLVLLGYTIYRISQRAHPSEAEHPPFAESLASTQTASNILDEEM